MKSDPKKVGLFVCHDLVGLLMLNKIVPEMKCLGLKPVIFNTGTHANKKLKNPSPSIVSAFNTRVLEGVIIPFLEKEGVESAGPNLTYKQLATKYDGEYREIQDVNNSALVGEIAADPAFIGAVSVRLLQVFSSQMIDAFGKKGFMWNLHSGLLPNYKGLLTPYRAIENGEKEYGLTLHDMTVGIDEGGIVAKGVLPLDSRRPVLDLYLDTVDAAKAIIINALSCSIEGKIPAGKPQSEPGAYYSNPTEDEFKGYIEKGIFYADHEHTIQRIVDAFTWAGTPRNNDLKENVKSFLGGQKQSPATSRPIINDLSGRGGI